MVLWASAAASTSPTGLTSPGATLPFPSLRTVENALLTTAKDDFTGHAKAFEAASGWTGGRLRESHGSRVIGAPHLACAEYGHGRQAYSLLQSFLSPEAVRVVSHSEEHGACYFATASHAEATAVSAEEKEFGLASFSPFPSALKLAPGLLEHGGWSPGTATDGTPASGRLRARHGEPMRTAEVEGLSLELAPGVLPAHSVESGAFISDLLRDLMSDSIDLHSTNFWSDPAMVEHMTYAEGTLRRENWSRAATVVHGLSEAAGAVPGDICSWNTITLHHAGDDVLMISGLDHLLHSGRGVGGSTEDGEAAELHVACFMGLLSFLAGRLETLRIAPRRSLRLHNSSARANIQSATVTETPLTDAGLDGTGQVVQVVDSGVDETSCFFVHDESGEKVARGYYFDEWTIHETASPDVQKSFGASSYPSSYEVLDYSYTQVTQVFTGGDFAAYPERRKIIQYINLIKSDDLPGSHGDYFTSSLGSEIPWLPADDFEDDDPAGHGSHTAGSVAGATLNNPAETVVCEAGKVLGCAGGCIDEDAVGITDDLVSSSASLDFDIDRLCPAFGCDDETYDYCLSDDTSQVLTDNGGMAQGAKLAIFDVGYELVILANFAGNGLWEPCVEAGCKIHSNSWGGDYECQLSTLDVQYDDFMYKNPHDLLIFSAGNIGDIERDTCTVNSPAIAKNVLAVGASTSGNTRLSASGSSDIDTVAFFSSKGPSFDGRVKPELVAPGDAIYSAAGDGTEDSSCRLWPAIGTSMSCPILAGASAMVRQYFMDADFYAAHVTARGLCDEWFGCEAFSPSAATLKALLINSANLMGGSSEPNDYRGFGRIHLEAGMPLGGQGNLTLFVADANYTSIPELTNEEYFFDVDADAGLDLRATLCWIDPAAVTFSTVQLVNDLDLSVISPNGTTHTMWASGMTDALNVNERVIVDADDVESGTWTVKVAANSLSSDVQTYSLVVNGAISPGTGDGQSSGSSSMSQSDFSGSDESHSNVSSSSSGTGSGSTSFSDSMESSSSDSTGDPASTSSSSPVESSSPDPAEDPGQPSFSSDSPIFSDFEDSIEDAGTSGNGSPAVTPVVFLLLSLVLGTTSFIASTCSSRY